MGNPLTTIGNAVAPERLGRSFRWLLASGMANNAGDGLMLAAGPLLVASQTRDPLLVSMAFLVQFLPSLLFGTVAGVLVDRFDRRRIVMAVDAIRALALGLLATSIVTETVSIAVVLAVLFVLGTAEIFADLGSSSILPRLVAREDLGIANARLQGAYLVTNQLVAPPIGAFLFAMGMALPFTVNALTCIAGGVLISRVILRRGDAGRPGEADEAADMGAHRATGSLRAEMAVGLRWLMAHAPMRTLALTIVAFNITFGAAWSVLVLYAGEQLGMDEVGFGLLATAMAIGGLIGTSAYGRLERRFSLADIMRVGLVIETGTHLVLALTRSPIVALVVMVVFGAHAFVWGTTSTAVRQRAVPDVLMGRVAGVYAVASVGGIIIGTPIGGLLARTWGVTAPFWFGFVGSAILVTVLWREFGHIVHAGDAPAKT